MVILGVVIQTAVLALAIIASHVKTRERITTLEAHKLHLAEKLLEIREDHGKLELKVMGISRHVEHLETIHRICPMWPPNRDIAGSDEG